MYQRDPLYQKFVQKWREVTDLPPQTVGPLTPIYKKTVPYLKFAPWRVLAPVSLILAAALAIILEVTSVQIASLLQRGF